MQFPTCHYASKEVEAGLRECSAPQLAGLKVVTPRLCLACVFRESQTPCNTQAQSSNTHTTQPLSDLFTCALQGERCSSADETVFACRHPSRETTTTAACRVCSDYLFPILSPELPVAIAKRLLPVLNPKLQPTGWWAQENAQQAARQVADDFIRTIHTYPGGFSGRGIVIAGGGKYFVSTYVTVRVLRHVGCRLPIQIWHFMGEADENMRAILAPYNVEWMNAETHPEAAAFRFHDTWWKGWQLKAFAILHCSFREILYLDADCYPVRDPSDVFDWKSYREFGATFFPDVEFSAGLLPKDAPAAFGVSDFTDTPNESGQLVIHKELCWRELNLALHYNQMPEFTYRHLWGDKDTFPLAWFRLGRKYARMWPTSQLTPQAILHFDQHHKVLFQHRAPDKFRLFGTKFDSNHQAYESNQFNPDLALEQFCHDACEELKTITESSGGIDSHPKSQPYFPPSYLKIQPTVITCPGREQILDQTLRSFGETDWTGPSPIVVTDENSCERRQERQVCNSLAALNRGLETGADFILFLEDDVFFNRHLQHNIQIWLRSIKNLHFGSLYHPGNLDPRDSRISSPTCMQADTESVYGSQAFLLARDFATYCVQRWHDEIPGMQDIKISRFAGKLGQPCYYHVPSLVQHMGATSTWGGGFHVSEIFDQNFKA